MNIYSSPLVNAKLSQLDSCQCRCLQCWHQKAPYSSLQPFTGLYSKCSLVSFGHIGTRVDHRPGRAHIWHFCFFKPFYACVIVCLCVCLLGICACCMWLSQYHFKTYADVLVLKMCLFQYGVPLPCFQVSRINSFHVFDNKLPQGWIICSCDGKNTHCYDRSQQPWHSAKTECLRAVCFEANFQLTFMHLLFSS